MTTTYWFTLGHGCPLQGTEIPLQIYSFMHSGDGACHLLCKGWLRHLQLYLGDALIEGTTIREVISKAKSGQESAALQLLIDLGDNISAENFEKQTPMDILNKNFWGCKASNYWDRQPCLRMMTVLLKNGVLLNWDVTQISRFVLILCKDSYLNEDTKEFIIAILQNDYRMFNFMIDAFLTCYNITSKNTPYFVERLNFILSLCSHKAGLVERIEKVIAFVKTLNIESLGDTGKNRILGLRFRYFPTGVADLNLCHVLVLCSALDELSYLKEYSTLIEDMVNGTDSMGNTPLHLALSMNLEKLVRAILNVKNVDINKRNELGHTPIMYAIKCCPRRTLHLLNHKDMLIKTKIGNGMNILEYILKSELEDSETGDSSNARLDLTKYIVEKFPALKCNMASDKKSLMHKYLLETTMCNNHPKARMLIKMLHLISTLKNFATFVGRFHNRIHPVCLCMNVMTDMIRLGYFEEKTEKLLLNIVNHLKAGEVTNCNDISKGTIVHEVVLCAYFVKTHPSAFICLSKIAPLVFEKHRGLLDALDTGGKTAISLASELNLTNIVLELVKSGAKCHHMSIVVKALKQEQPVLALSLLENARVFNINQTDSKGRTLLHYAAELGKMQLVEVILLDGVCNLEVEDLNGETALHLAARKHNLKVVSLIIQDIRCNVYHGSNIWRSILECQSKSDSNLVAKLLDVVTKKFHQVMQSNSWNSDALSMIWILPKFVPDTCDRNGQTALMYIIEHAPDDIEKLKSSFRKISGSIKDSYGNTALHYAVMKQNVQLVDVVLSLHDKAVSMASQDEDNNTALDKAVFLNAFQCVERILNDNQFAVAYPPAACQKLVTSIKSNTDRVNVSVKELIKAKLEERLHETSLFRYWSRCQLRFAISELNDAMYFNDIRRCQPNDAMSFNGIRRNPDNINIPGSGEDLENALLDSCEPNASEIGEGTGLFDNLRPSVCTPNKLWVSLRSMQNKLAVTGRYSASD